MKHRQPEVEQALEAWREDEEGAFAGKCLSAETRADSHAGHDGVDKKTLQRLAEEHTEIFMGLVDQVSPLAQDVLIQYYILRRTQEQIGQILGVTQHWIHYMLGQAIDEIKGKRKPTKKDFEFKKVEIRRGKWLGAAEVGIEEGVLNECFQPTNGNV